MEHVSGGETYMHTSLDGVRQPLTLINQTQTIQRGKHLTGNYSSILPTFMTCLFVNRINQPKPQQREISQSKTNGNQWNPDNLMS